jgi:hypothetical protein
MEFCDAIFTSARPNLYRHVRIVSDEVMQLLFVPEHCNLRFAKKTGLEKNWWFPRKP